MVWGGVTFPGCSLSYLLHHILERYNRTSFYLWLREELCGNAKWVSSREMLEKGRPVDVEIQFVDSPIDKEETEVRAGVPGQDKKRVSMKSDKNI